MSDQPTLKPCPFCGETAVAGAGRRHSDLATFPWEGVVTCPSGHAIRNCGKTPELAERAACDEWNRRAPVEITDAALDAYGVRMYGENYQTVPPWMRERDRECIAAALNQSSK